MSELHRSGPPVRHLSRRAVLRGMAGAAGAAALYACSGVSVSPSPTSAPTTAPATPAGSAGSAPPSAGATATATATPEPTPVPSPEGALNVYNWADYIGEHTIQKFEDKYGIKVQYDFFDNIDTMLAKISTGNSGYDVTFPTSINVPGLKARNLIQPLDLGLVPNLVNLADEWKNPAYDPGNANSVPYMWWTTGVAYDSKKVDGTPDSWDTLWDPKYSGKMAMLDDYRECFSAALFRLGFDINTTDEGQLDQALAMLQQQKPLLRTYTTDDIGVLSSGDAWIMHAWGGDVYQVTPERKSVKYYLPKEGAVRGSDTMVLLAGAQHPIAAQLFMNFMLDAQIAADNTNLIGYMGPNEAAKQFIDPTILKDPTVNPSQAVVATLQEIQDLGDDEKKYQDRWTTLRAGA
jgi:spermidine/putrescine transport system substrate-binding protein